MQSPIGKMLLSLSCLLAGIVSAALPYPMQGDPDPLRFEDQIRKFLQEDAVNLPPAGAIVGVGSSSLRMWHDRIQRDLEGLTIIPRGFGGSQFSDAIYFARELILKHRPRAILVYEGDNDAAHGKSPERILADLRYLAKLCRGEVPELRFYVISIKPSPSRWEIWPRMAEANRLMREWCEATEGATYIDVATALLDEKGLPREGIFLDDQLHLNQAGYDLWAAAIAPVLLAGERDHE